MNRPCSLLLLVALIGLLYGCNGPSELPPVAYVQWVKDPTNGLFQTKALGVYAFAAQYKPLDFVVAQEERTAELPTAVLDARKEELGEDHLYFNFKITHTEGQRSPLEVGAGSGQAYQYRLGYFTFDMQRDLYLLHGRDTFPCTLFQLVRSYDVAPYVSFALGFEKPPVTPLTQDLTFVFEDQVLGVGPVRLFFDASNLTPLPTLKTS